MDKVTTLAGGLIELALREDLGRESNWLSGDVTVQACVTPEARGMARIEARQAGIICGISLAGAVFQAVGGDTITLNYLVNDGDSVKPGDRLLEISGSLRVILCAERSALNFLQRLSGIATATGNVTRRTLSGVEILDTRKTTPGWRRLEKYAVVTGGGRNHRQGLFDMYLIKENHIRAAGGLAEAIRAARDHRVEFDVTCKIEAEVESLAELEVAIESGADIVMLDNFSPHDIIRAVEITDSRVKLEVSGGINEENLDEYLIAGVDYISLGSLTHSAKAFDLSLLVEEMEN
jgi:nicotinate-nucleotide pyrophosphorylase (carboxylating)